MHCPNCGNVVTAGAPMCPHCHASLAPAPTAAAPAYGAAGMPGGPSIPGHGVPGSPPIPGIPAGPGATTGFFKSLFDSSFAKLITPGLLRVFWIIFLVVWSVYSGIWFIIGLTMMTESPAYILFSLVVVPIMYLIGIIFYRVAFEFIAAFFRMADDIRDLRNAGGR